MTEASATTPAEDGGRTAPIAAPDRITNLDTVRGVATLGILLMNAVAFGLIDPAYFNLDAQGSDNWLDWTIGVLGEVVVDQKMMGLFSLLFGVGIVVFADRAAIKGRRPVRLSLWRNTLLLGIGLLHTLLWDGDVLVVYALCSPVLLAMRKRSPRTLFVTGGLMMLTSALLAAVTQGTIDAAGADLGFVWSGTADPSDAVFGYLIADAFLRALGMMLIGVGLFRLEIVQGRLPAERYRRMAKVGLGVGLPVAAIGVVIQLASDFDPDIALVSAIPNTLATVPVVLGYLAVITLWNQRAETAAHHRIRAVGRMALTNYLTQTVIGIAVLRVLFDRGELSRTGILVFVVCVWALQILWSKPWLDRFRFGPLEWAWRCVTYRKLQPLRR